MTNKLTSVTLELDMSETSASLKTVLDALTIEDKRDVAKTLLQEWVDAPVTTERVDFERELVAKMLEEKEAYSNSRKYRDESAVRGSFQFKDRLKNHQSVREHAIKHIYVELLAQAQKQVEEIITNNEQMQKMISSVSMAVVDRIPAMIQATINAKMIEQINIYKDALDPAGTVQATMEQELTIIKERLGMP